MFEDSSNFLTLLPTALIMVQDSRTSYQKFRALLDSAAECSLISEKCVQSLNLTRNHACVNIKGVSSISAGKTKGSVELNILPTNKFPLSVRALIMKNLTSHLPPITVDVKKYDKIQSLKLADPHFNRSSSVDILLGGDIFLKLLCPEKYQLDEDLFAQNTCFGYVISGKASLVTRHDSVLPYGSVMNCQLDLHDIIQKFWEVEDIMPPDAQIEHWCESHYKQTILRDHESGKYIARLPFKLNSPDLGDSLPMATRRLFAMERRFKKFPELKNEYTKFMREYIELGHMSLIPYSELKTTADTKIFYLPHHAVMKQSSSTTKLRVVFDGSSKSSTGVSLNEKLDPGPSILQELFSILVRFRKHQIAFAADVEKMFRQVIVHEDDRDYQRVVWREDSNGPILHFRLNTVTYGTTCATFLAARTLRQIANDLPSDFNDVKKIIRSDFYVDDLLSGCASIKEAVHLQPRIAEGLRTGGFKLRKWVTNSEELLKCIPQDERDTLVEFDNGERFVKTLGLVWITDSDCFTFKINNMIDNGLSTKRSFLSATGRIFDPLGFLSPCTVLAKILFQQLWLRKLDWDDPLPKNVDLQWEKLRSNFSVFEKIQIPRFLNILQSPIKLELHGFADAYAAVVYSSTNLPA